jgi:hypothetical protein
MGASYNRDVTQFSNGDYRKANNQQDDIAIIGKKLQFRVDDVSNSTVGATPLTLVGTVVSAMGILESSSDTDVFAFTTNIGPITITASPFSSPTRTAGGNADLVLSLLSASGAVIATAAPSTGCGATITRHMATGAYFVRVGAGGNPLTPYSAYGSMGQYDIRGAVQARLMGATMLSGAPGWTLSPGTSLWKVGKGSAPDPADASGQLGTALGGSGLYTEPISATNP